MPEESFFFFLLFVDSFTALKFLMVRQLQEFFFNQKEKYLHLKYKRKF